MCIALVHFRPIKNAGGDKNPELNTRAGDVQLVSDDPNTGTAWEESLVYLVASLPGPASAWDFLTEEVWEAPPSAPPAPVLDLATKNAWSALVSSGTKTDLLSASNAIRGYLRDVAKAQDPQTPTKKLKHRRYYVDLSKLAQADQDTLAARKPIVDLLSQAQAAESALRVQLGFARHGERKEIRDNIELIDTALEQHEDALAPLAISPVTPKDAALTDILDVDGHTVIGQIGSSKWIIDRGTDLG